MERLSDTKKLWFLAVFVVGVGMNCCGCIGKELKMVHLLYRHGDRSPIFIYPTDPHKEVLWPNGLGWLTQKGMRMEYELGQYLRKRYVTSLKFLNSSYLRSQVYVRSSGAERCQMSAQTQLAGLYPPSGWQVWNSNISWQPIPMYVAPINKDPVIRPWNAGCAKLKELLAEKFKSKEYLDMENNSKDFRLFLANKTGLTSLPLVQLLQLCDTIVVEKFHNLTQPAWLTNDSWQRLQKLSQWLYKFLFVGGDGFSRLSGGPLIKEIIQNMDKLKNNKTDGLTKLNIYSGHDTSIIALLGSLGIYTGPSPPYSSCVIIELYRQSNGDFTVEILYRNSTKVQPMKLKLTSCTYDCKLEYFVRMLFQIALSTCHSLQHESTYFGYLGKGEGCFGFSLLKNRIPADYDKECGNEKQETDEKTSDPRMVQNNMTIITVLVVVIAILLVVIVGLMGVMKRKKKLRLFKLKQKSRRRSSSLRSQHEEERQGHGHSDFNHHHHNSRQEHGHDNSHHHSRHGNQHHVKVLHGKHSPHINDDRPGHQEKIKQGQSCDYNDNHHVQVHRKDSVNGCNEYHKLLSSEEREA